MLIGSLTVVAAASGFRILGPLARLGGLAILGAAILLQRSAPVTPVAGHATPSIATGVERS